MGHGVQPVATLAVIIATVITSYRGFTDQRVLERYMFQVEGILGYRQYYRILSSGFMHANGPHLFFNMFCFYSFGQSIERYFGWPLLLGIYAASLIGGSLLALAIHRNHGDYCAVGASGAVSGILFASIFLLPGGSVMLMFLPIPIPASVFAIGYTAVSIYGIKSQRGNIGHDAHLGGAITGLLLIALLYPRAVLHSLGLFLLILALVLGFFGYYFRQQLRDLFDQWQARGQTAQKNKSTSQAP
ncbi:rhomboid family intramembrane serine protease, partial [Planctomycetota bacterium]